MIKIFIEWIKYFVHLTECFVIYITILIWWNKLNILLGKIKYFFVDILKIILLIQPNRFVSKFYVYIYIFFLLFLSIQYFTFGILTWYWLIASRKKKEYLAFSRYRKQENPTVQKTGDRYFILVFFSPCIRGNTNTTCIVRSFHLRIHTLCSCIMIIGSLQRRSKYRGAHVTLNTWTVQMRQPGYYTVCGI